MFLIDLLFLLAQSSVQNGQTLLESAVSAYNDGLYEVAVSQLEDFMDLYPDSPYRKQALYYLARSYFELGEYDKAENYFRNLLSLYSTGEEVAQAVYYLGVIEYNRGDIRKATARLRQVINEFPDSKVAEDAYYLLAKIFGEKALKEPEWTSQAVAYYKRFLQKYPHSRYRGEALSSLAELLYRSGDLGEAEKYAREAYREGSKPEALSILAKVYARMGKYDEAFDCLKELSELSQEGPSPQRNETLRSSGIRLEELFVKTVLEVQSLFPGDLREELLKEASGRDTPLSIKASMELASLYADEGRNEKALVVIDRVLLSLDKYSIENKDEVKAQLLLLKGKVLLAMGRVSEAEGIAENLEGDGKHVILGYVYLKKGETQKAVEEFSKVKKGPLKEAALIGAATALLRVDEKKKALKFLSEIPVPPEGGEQIAVSAASLYYSVGEYQKVLEMLEEFNSDQALSLKGWAALALGDYDSAYKYFSLMSGRCESSFGKAMVLYNQRNYDEAIRLFEEVSSGNCSWTDKALYWEGWCYYKKQDYIRAVNIWKELQRRFPASDLCDDAQFYIVQTFYTMGDLNSVLEASSRFLSEYQNSPYYGDVLLLKGEALVGLGRYSEAFAPLKIALEEYGKKEAVVYLAGCYASRGELRKAEGMLLDFVKEETQDPHRLLYALNKLGELYTTSPEKFGTRSSLAKKLSSLYESAASRFPGKKCLFFYNCAVFLHRMGELSLAASYYKKVASLKCEYSRDAKRFLASIYLQQGKCDEACSIYREILSTLRPEEKSLLPEILASLADCGRLSMVSRYIDMLDKDSSVYHYLKARILEKKDPQKALEEYRRAVSYMDLWSQRAQFQRGALLYSMKKYKEAGGEFAKVYYNWKDSTLAPAALYWATLSYKLAGEISLARKVLGILVEKFPDSPEARKARRDFTDLLKQ